MKACKGVQGTRTSLVATPQRLQQPPLPPQKDAIKLLAFAFLKRRGPQGAKLSDISAYVASSLLPGSENAPDGSSEAKERKATIKSTGVYVRQDDAFVPLVVPGHYALRGHLTKEMMEKARQAEAERAAKAEVRKDG